MLIQNEAISLWCLEGRKTMKKWKRVLGINTCTQGHDTRSSQGAGPQHSCLTQLQTARCRQHLSGASLGESTAHSPVSSLSCLCDVRSPEQEHRFVLQLLEIGAEVSIPLGSYGGNNTILWPPFFFFFKFCLIRGEVKSFKYLGNSLHFLKQYLLYNFLRNIGLLKMRCVCVCVFKNVKQGHTC